MTSEQEARKTIDSLLTQAGWSVQDYTQADLYAAPGVALREFPLKAGHGFADYLLYVDGRAAGVIEAKKPGLIIAGVENPFPNRWRVAMLLGSMGPRVSSRVKGAPRGLGE